MSKTGTKFRDGDAQNVYDGGLQTWKFYYDLLNVIRSMTREWP